MNALFFRRVAWVTGKTKFYDQPITSELFFDIDLFGVSLNINRKYKSLFSILRSPSFRRLFPPALQKILEIHKVSNFVLCRQKTQKSGNRRNTEQTLKNRGNKPLFFISRYSNVSNIQFFKLLQGQRL